MHRFYIPQSFSDKQPLQLKQADEIHHLKNVLRLGVNDTIQVFDGKGLTASAIISGMTHHSVTLNIHNVIQTFQNLPALILACAIPKKGKFETIIEKTTELGVDEIIPIITHNSDVQYTKEKAIQKQARFQKVAINAAKQSNRSIIPVIHPVTPIQSALETLIEKTIVIIPSLTPDTVPILQSLRTLKNPSVISIFIGPEGDFSKDEYQTIHSAGGIAVNLGDTILKVETAAITAVGVSKLYFND